MANISGVKTNWQNVSDADWLANNATAVNNRLTAARLNALGQAITNVNAEVTGFQQGYAALPTGTTLTLWYDNGWPPRPTLRSAIVVQWCSVDYQGIPPGAIPGIDFLRVMEYQPIPDPDPDPTPVEDGNILATLDFEDQIHGTAIAPIIAGWSMSGTGINNLMASSAAAIHGSLGARSQGGEDARYPFFSETSAANTRVLDLYLRIQNIANNAYVLRLSDSGTGRADVRINTDRSVTVRNGSIAVGQTEEGFQLKTNNEYRFSWKVSPAGQHLRIYDLLTSEWVAEVIAPLGNAMAGAYAFCVPIASVDTVIDFDTCRVGDDWIPAHV